MTRKTMLTEEANFSYFNSCRNIDKDFYCSASAFGGTEWCNLKNKICIGIAKEGVFCSCYHRKHPTLEQFKEEYSEEWTGAVYYRSKTKWIEKTKTHEWTDWFLASYEDYKYERSQYYECVLFEVVCTCTPFGVPDNDWRPE